MFENKNVLITGGTGFLGTNFTKYFVANELNANLYLAQRSYPNIDYSEYPSVKKIITLDLTTTNPFEDTRMDMVIHCAAYTGGAEDIKNNSSLIVRENTHMNMRLLDSAAKSGVKKFLFISSSAVYAEPPSDDYELREYEGWNGIPAAPLTMPGYMKRYGEQLCQFYFENYGMEVLVVRPANVYGRFSNFDPKKSHVIPALIRKFVERQYPLEVWGSPDTQRDFVYVDDFVTNAMNIFKKFKDFRIVNIGSGKLVTIDYVVKLLQQFTDYDGQILYNHNKPSTFKSKILHNFATEYRFGKFVQTPLTIGLLETLNWYKETIKQ